MGLVQREIEQSGIPTIGISIVKEYTEKVKPPRTIYLRRPFGHPLGGPFQVDQQAAVLAKTFDALYQITEPGAIIDFEFKSHSQVFPR